MNKLLLTALLAVIISSCDKSATVANEDPIPVADFRISNSVAPDAVIDGDAIQIVNNSQHAQTYEWDFGDGVVSAERTPAGVSLRRCPRTQDIRLTVRTRTGRTATIIRTITVRCR